MERAFIVFCVIWSAIIAVCFTPLLPLVGFLGALILALIVGALSGLARLLGLPMQKSGDPGDFSTGVLMLLIPLVGLLVGYAAIRANAEFRRQNDQKAYGWLILLTNVVGFGVTAYVGIIPFLQQMQRLR